MEIRHAFLKWQILIIVPLLHNKFATCQSIHNLYIIFKTIFFNFFALKICILKEMKVIHVQSEELVLLVFVQLSMNVHL